MTDALKIISSLYYALIGKDHLSERDTAVLIEAYNFMKKNGGLK